MSRTVAAQSIFPHGTTCTEDLFFRLGGAVQ
jgi:hypothetical protein